MFVCVLRPPPPPKNVRHIYSTARRSCALASMSGGYLFWILIPATCQLLEKMLHPSVVLGCSLLLCTTNTIDEKRPKRHARAQWRCYFLCCCGSNWWRQRYFIVVCRFHERNAKRVTNERIRCCWIHIDRTDKLTSNALIDNNFVQYTNHSHPEKVAIGMEVGICIFQDHGDLEKLQTQIRKLVHFSITIIRSCWYWHFYSDLEYYLNYCWLWKYVLCSWSKRIFYVIVIFRF